MGCPLKKATRAGFSPRNVRSSRLGEPHLKGDVATEKELGNDHVFADD
jgi:hypothetical protein